MTKNWVKTTVGEFCPFSYGKGLPEIDRKPGVIPVFGSNGLVGNHDNPYVSHSGIIIGRKGSVGEVHYSKVPFWPIDTTFFVTIAKDRDIRFTYYLLKSLGLKKMNSDSAVPGLNRDAAHNREIFVPLLPEQHVIADVFSALDEKIELNRRMNATLEDLAQTLFKHWFIDNPEREKWDMGSIGEDFNLTMGQSPPGETYNEQEAGEPFFQGRTDFGFRYPTNRIYCTAPTRFAKEGDTLVSVRAPVGDINIALEDCAIGRGLASIRHKTGSRSYTYYSMNHLKSVFNNFESEGTVFGSINKDAFLSINVFFPHSEQVEEFEKLCYPLDQKIENNEKETRTLVKLRDTLLPFLINGKIRVK